MPSYNIKQIAYNSKDQCVEDIEIKTPFSAQGSAQTGDDPRSAPYQQIVIQPSADSFTFSASSTYFLDLEIPKNQNYDLQFGVRLIDYQDSSSGADLDSLNYQFVKYLTIYKASNEDSENSRVVLFQEPNYDDSKPVQVAIAEEVAADAITTTSYVTGVMYHSTYEGNNIFYWCKEDNAPWPVDGSGKYISNVGHNSVLLSHSWKTEEADQVDKFRIIFKPRKEGLTAIYLHLIPNSDDNDIQWQVTQSGQTSTYYGRHIDLDSGLFKANLYRLKNLIDGYTAKKLGIWGHPGQMFHIEGEEIRIGPSGYYELENFSVSELGIAAFGSEDRFTIDIQYI